MTAGERFGRQVANVGDVDGNGADDLAVGADMALPLRPHARRRGDGRAAARPGAGGADAEPTPTATATPTPTADAAPTVATPTPSAADRPPPKPVPTLADRTLAADRAAASR